MSICFFRSFKLQRLPSELEPKEIEKSATKRSDNVFIFTPLQLGVKPTDAFQTDVGKLMVESSIGKFYL